MAKITKKTEKYIIVDELMDQEYYTSLTSSIQNIRFDYPGTEWRKLWPLTDPLPLQSGSFLWSKKPCGFGIDPAIESISAEILSAQASGFVEESWADIAFRIYLHGRGSRLQCHSDSPLYAGAAVFYAHEEWRPYWGGELVFPDINNESDVELVHGDGPILNKRLRMTIERQFCGEYVSPKPNRLVIIKAGAWHYTNPVDQSAGDNIRISIATFLQKNRGEHEIESNLIDLGE